MSATKIAEPANLRRGLDRTADDALKTAASLHFKRIKQTVRSFADRNDKDIAKGIQIVEILADAEDSALTIYIPLKALSMLASARACSKSWRAVTRISTAARWRSAGEGMVEDYRS